MARIFHAHTEGFENFNRRRFASVIVGWARGGEGIVFWRLLLGFSESLHGLLRHGLARTGGAARSGRRITSIAFAVRDEG